jgi:hypothetical protein
VADLGLKSNLNMHRAHSGSFRVRIEARHGGWDSKISGKLIFEWINAEGGMGYENTTNTSRTGQNGLRQQGI